jgi:hypothetical protein
MDAAADYAAALRMLDAQLPAYVSYVERSYASAGDLTKDTHQTVVVRTKDGAVVKGVLEKVKFSTDDGVPVNPVSHPPFNASCFVAREARSAQWDGHEVEAIAIHDTCEKKLDSDTDFQTLYVNPVTHDPIAAVGTHEDDHVTVSVEQRLTRYDGHVMPSGLRVHLQGHGIAGFLNFSAGQDYGDYRFSNTMP